jgi:anti-sigma regulatory factor (Ser/Thr protein kinase)
MIKQLTTEGILSEKALYFIELCLSEAVVNCIQHAYHERPDGDIDIGILIGEDHVTIDVGDTGTPLPPNSLARHMQKAIEFDPADVAGLPETGRGLAIILNHMDSVAYFSKSGRNTLRMRLNIGEK